MHEVVDSWTEACDLLWHFDVVERLAEAQIANAMGIVNRDDLRKTLDVLNCVRLGPLWWGFIWDDANRRAEIVKALPPKQRDGGKTKRGVTVLFDEIDKAEDDVPNGLLEALGAGDFLPYGRHDPVTAKSTPLVVIAANEERALPDAFIRRCLVLPLDLPLSGDGLITWLFERGKAHFPKMDVKIRRAAEAKLYPGAAHLISGGGHFVMTGSGPFFTRAGSTSEAPEAPPDRSM